VAVASLSHRKHLWLSLRFRTAIKRPAGTEINLTLWYELYKKGWLTLLIKYLEKRMILANLLISFFFCFGRKEKRGACPGNIIVKNATIKEKRRGDARG
jgi:hypothetical protein